MSSEIRAINLVVVGDRVDERPQGGSMKTTLLVSYASGSYPEEYVPTTFDNYTHNLMVGQAPIALGLWDTSGPEEWEYDRLRPLFYQQTDIFILLFSVINYESYEHVGRKWIPELRNFCPDVPYILVGCQTELRLCEETLEELRKKGQQPIMPEEGRRLAGKIGAIKYLECSARTGEGLKQVFDEAVQAVLFNKQPEHTNILDSISIEWGLFRKERLYKKSLVEGKQEMLSVWRSQLAAKHTTRRKLQRRIRIPAPTPRSLFFEKESQKSSWTLDLFSADIGASTFQLDMNRTSLLSWNDPAPVLSSLPPHDFQQPIDTVLGEQGKYDRRAWIDLLAFIGGHPSSLMLSGWNRLKPMYATLFWENPVLDNDWLMTMHSTKAILAKHSDLKEALEEWASLFLKNLLQKIEAESSGAMASYSSMKTYKDTLDFIQEEFYPVLKDLPHQAWLQVESLDCIAKILRYLEPERNIPALLFQAIALSLCSDEQQKRQKEEALYMAAEQEFNKRVRHWQQNAGKVLVQRYQDEQIKQLQAALYEAKPNKFLQHLANVIQFSLQQQRLEPLSKSTNTFIMDIFYSPWLVQEHDGIINPTQDDIWLYFRSLWLKLVNLNTDIEPAIETLKLLTKVLLWVLSQKMHNQEINAAERLRYLTRLSTLLQNQFFFNEKIAPIVAIRDEEKSAIVTRLLQHWPQRIAYCAQIGANSGNEPIEDVTSFWERICLEAGVEHSPLWLNEDLPQILPDLRQRLAQGRDSFRVSVDTNIGVLTHSPLESHFLKAVALKSLREGLEKLWHAALKKMAVAAPCRYALVFLGSVARGDATLYSDLEFLLLVDAHHGDELQFRKSLAEGEITAYFKQVFDLFLLEVELLGESQAKAANVNEKIWYRIGIHLDDKLMPFIGDECFFGTPTDLAAHFALGKNSSMMDWHAYLQQVEDSKILQGQKNAANKQEQKNVEYNYSITAASASYDADFFCGDKALFTEYNKKRYVILSTASNEYGYSSRSVLALSFCEAAVLKPVMKNTLLQEISVKHHFLSRISGLIKTLSIYHGRVDVNGSEIMGTMDRCRVLLSRGIIAADLMSCLEMAYVFCDRFRALSYAIYDEALDDWILFGENRFNKAKTKFLWHKNVGIWKEAIVMLHQVIYPLNQALSTWLEEAKSTFSVERFFALEPEVLAGCQKTLLNEGRNIQDRFAEVAYEILAQQETSYAFLPRLTQSWWQFLLVTVLNLSSLERRNLWISLLPKLSSVHREQFVEIWGNTIQNPQNLRQQHAYLTEAERKTLGTQIAKEFNDMAEELCFPDGWSILAYSKQKEWRCAVAELFSEEISTMADLERIVVQEKSVVIGCANPYLSPQELNACIRQDKTTAGLFVLNKTMQAAVEAKERESFVAAKAKPKGKRHIVLAFEHTLNGETYHFCLKLFPENPGMEYDMTQLQYLLGGIGETPNVWLWRVYTPFYPDGIAALLMEDVHGLQHRPIDKKGMVRMSEIGKNKNNSSIWLNLDIDSYTRHFLRVVLSNPEDDKANDYWAIPKHCLGDESYEYILRRIDNERSLYISELFEHKMDWMSRLSGKQIEPVLKVKTLIYCMEQMGMPLSTVVLKRLMQMNTKAAFKRWLEDIARWNASARDVFRPKGIMTEVSLSLSSETSLSEKKDFSLAHLHCQKNIYRHGVFHAAENPLYKKEEKNFCLVVMPVPMDKFIQVYLILNELQDLIKAKFDKKEDLTGFEVLRAIRPEHYKYYYEKLTPSLRIGYSKQLDPNALCDNTYARFTEITKGGYKKDGASSQNFPTMVTSGLGELMQAKDYERVLLNEIPCAGNLPADTAEWLVFTLTEYERKQYWDDERQMIDQILLSRFQSLLEALSVSSDQTFSFWGGDSVPPQRLDQVLTEFRNLSLNNRVKFCRHFLGGRAISGWDARNLHKDVKKYLLDLLLKEYLSFETNPLHSLNTESFCEKDVLDEKRLLDLLKKYGQYLSRAVIVATFDMSLLPEFKKHIESCNKLIHLELRVVMNSVIQPVNVNEFYGLHYTLPQVRELILSGFIKVNKLSLNMPELNRLIVRSLTNLYSFEVDVMKLHWIEMYHCPKIGQIAFEAAIWSKLSIERRMPVVKLDNTAVKKTLFEETAEKRLWSEEDVKVQIDLIAQFTVLQWKAMEYLFSRTCTKKKYILSLDRLNEEERLKDLYSNPELCGDFCKALIAAIKILKTVYPVLELVDILATSAEKDGFFMTALKLACDEELAVNIHYNGVLLYGSQFAKAEASSVSAPGMQK